MKLSLKYLRVLILFSLLVQPVFALHMVNKNAYASTLDEKIAFYEAELKRYPRDYAYLGDLGLVYFQKTLQTFDPVWIERARKSLLASIEIQPTHLAHRTLASVQNYSHRFEEAIKWAKKAQLDEPSDGQLIAIQVEAYMGLGKMKEARALLPEHLEGIKNPYVAGALGEWYSHNGHYTESLEAFNLAADLAKKLSVQEKELLETYVWAKVSAAGTYIDSHQYDKAENALSEIKKITPENKNYMMHQAELYAARNDYKNALEMYTHILSKKKDPAICHLAFKAAKKLNMPELSKEHFEAALKGYSLSYERGEVYYLNALEALYKDANMSVPQKLEETMKKNSTFMGMHKH